MPVYLDHHATTPLASEARAAMFEAMSLGHGNPSSVHSLGRAARDAMELARTSLANAIGARARELVFTSGGTEAVHLAVRGVARGRRPTRVLCDPGAHPCLRAASELAAATAGVGFEWLPTSQETSELRAAVTDGALVTVSLVQHETGAVARLEALHEVCHARGATLVLDAVQAVGKLTVDLAATGAAAAAVSAHKFGGPGGVGAVWLRTEVPAEAIQSGGGQERGLRAGTENVLGAIGMGAAAHGIAARRTAMPAVAARRDAIERSLLSLGATVNSAEATRVATVSHVAFRDLAAPELVAALDLEGYCVSSGAACSSGRAEPSESILRMFPGEPWRATGALRVSLGPSTTDAEVERFIATLTTVVARVRY